MKSKSHYSLSTINIFLILTFVSVVMFPISFWTYINFQKTIERSFDDYFVQSKNIAEILLEQEAIILNNYSKDISQHLILEHKNNNHLLKFNNAIIDEVNIAFVVKNDEITDLSTSLYDTNYLIRKINYRLIGEQTTVFNIEKDGKNYLILLKMNKVINPDNGRVFAYLFVGNILNDNFSFLTKIKEKANMKEVALYVNGKYIASTQDQDQMKYRFDELSDDKILQKDNEIYAKKRLHLFNENYKIDLVLSLDNKMSKTIKNDFFNQIILLLFIILLIAFLSYFLIKSIILNPLENLLAFASKVRDDKNATYKKSFIEEFNSISMGLENIIGSLRDVEERYRLAVDGTKEGLWDWDILQQKVFYSQQYEEMLGYKPNEMDNQLHSWSDSIHPSFKEYALSKMKAHIKQEIPYYEAEYQMKCKNGTYKWVKVRGKALYDKNNVAYRMVGFHLDIDDLKQLEKKNKEQESIMAQQSKMAAIGEMIKNISHQWRQPLSIISTVATGIKLKLEYDIFNKEEAIKDLDTLNNTSQYLSSIIDQFRNLAVESTEKEDFDSAFVIHKGLTLLDNNLKESGIKLYEDLEHKQLFAYKNQLIQIVLSIVNNAKDAIMKLGPKASKLIFVETKEIDGHFTLRIYDNGKGVEEEIKESLYEPYTTTKHESQGTGLGLYTVKEIVTKQFGGTVSNKTIHYTYQEKSYTGEEFIIQFN